MLYTLATGLRPFVEAESDSAAAIMARMADARYLANAALAESRLQGTSLELRALIRAMLELDPGKRATMREVRRAAPLHAARHSRRSCALPRLPPRERRKRNWARV